MCRWPEYEGSAPKSKERAVVEVVVVGAQRGLVSCNGVAVSAPLSLCVAPDRAKPRDALFCTLSCTSPLRAFSQEDVDYEGGGGAANT